MTEFGRFGGQSATFSIYLEILLQETVGAVAQLVITIGWKHKRLGSIPTCRQNIFSFLLIPSMSANEENPDRGVFVTGRLS